MKKSKKFIAPSLDEVIQYFIDKGYSKELATTVFDYYSVADWHDSNGKKIKNWKQKAIGVWFRPENKTSEPKTKGRIGRAINAIDKRYSGKFTENNLGRIDTNANKITG